MWPFRRRQFRAGDPNDLFRELAAVRNDGRTEMDKYRDFRRVFGSEEGRRVLDDILALAHMGHSSIPVTAANVPIDPFKMAASEGERRLGLKIATIMAAEPKRKQNE